MISIGPNTVFIPFELLPYWNQSSWIESWAFWYNLKEYCEDRFGPQGRGGRWDADHVENNVIHSNIDLPNRLIFVYEDDAIAFRLGFK